MEGILLALVPMFAWGIITPLSVKFGGSTKEQTFGMTLGAFVFALLVYSLTRPSLDMKVIIFGILGGILWGLGQNFLFLGIKAIGVSTAGPLISGSQLVLGSLIGAFLFGEWSKPIQILLGMIAICILSIGFYYASRVDKNDVHVHRADFLRGIRYILIMAAFFLSYTVLYNNIMMFDTLKVLLPMSIGMVLSGAMMFGKEIRWTSFVGKNMLAGIIWGIGNLSMLLSARVAGLAIAFSFSQLSSIVTVLGGIFILHERKTKKEAYWLLIGMICFVIGAILLGIVKAQ